MKRWLVLTLLLTALLPLTGYSAYDAGTQNPFELGAGARALAMSGAYTAVADDVTALFWNPAGLARLDQVELSAMHLNLFYGTPYDFLGAAYPLLDWGTFAVGAVRLATDGIVLRDENSYILGAREGSFDLREYLVGYGRDLPLGLRLGAVAKVEQERLLGNVGTGVGLDLGLQYQWPSPAGGWENLVLGVSVQNVLASQIRLERVGEILPLNVRAGLAYPVAFQDGLGQRLLIAAAMEKSTWREWGWRAGVEYSLLELLALRGGFQEGAWTAGAGMQYAGVGVDYALSGQELGLTHRVSLTWKLGPALSEQRQERERRRQEEMDREAGRRAEEAVKNVRTEMDQQLKNAERRYQREKQAILVKQERKLSRAVAEERQRQVVQRHQDLEREYFKSLHYFLGIKDYLAKNFKQAVTEFETVDKYDPNYLELPLWLGRARQMAQGEHFVMSESNLVLYYQGIDLYVENRFAEAIQVWKKILVAEPNNLMALRNIEEAESRLATLNNARVGGKPAATAEPVSAADH